MEAGDVSFLFFGGRMLASLSGPKINTVERAAIIKPLPLWPR